MHDVRLSIHYAQNNYTTSNNHPRSFLRLPVRTKLENMTIIYFGLVLLTLRRIYIILLRIAPKFLGKRHTP